MGLVNLLGATRSPWPIQVFQVAKMDVLCNTRRYSRVDFLMHRLPNIFFTLVFCLQFRYLKHPLKKSFRNSEEDLSRRVFPWVGRWLRYDFFSEPIKYHRPWITRVAKSHEFLKSTAEVLARLQQDATGFNRDMRCQSQKCFVLQCFTCSRVVR